MKRDRYPGATCAPLEILFVLHALAALLYSPSAGAQPRCADGRVATREGYCCWPGQQWSADRDRCTGAPNCPSGYTAEGATCVRDPSPAQPATGFVPVTPPQQQPVQYAVPTANAAQPASPAYVAPAPYVVPAAGVQPAGQQLIDYREDAPGRVTIEFESTGRPLTIGEYYNELNYRGRSRRAVRSLCITPCALHVPPGVFNLHAGGAGMRESTQQLRVADPMRVRIRAGTSASFGGGVALIVIGAAGFIPNVIFGVFIGASYSCDLRTGAGFDSGVAYLQRNGNVGSCGGMSALLWGGALLSALMVGGGALMVHRSPAGIETPDANASARLARPPGLAWAVSPTLGPSGAGMMAAMAW